MKRKIAIPWRRRSRCHPPSSVGVSLAGRGVSRDRVRRRKIAIRGDVGCPCDGAPSRHAFERGALRTRARIIFIGMAKF
ncbi:hypothetical protein BURPS668_1602 [Burkholderia pseudomallei 668]|nr:hypothetical protein BURPS668_1602 [Burkholderia pseudomallei 668]